MNRSNEKIPNSAEYHWILIVLFGFLEKMKTTSNPPESGPSSTIASFIPSPTDLCVASAIKIGAICKRYQQLYGLGHMSAFMMQAPTVGLFTLLPHLDSRESRSAFFHLAVIARANVRLWPLAVGMLKMVQMTAQEMNVKIPTESSVFFEEFETEVWAKQDTSVFNADYPNFAIASGQSSSVPGPAGLSDLIKTWGKLSFESPESKEEGEGDEEKLTISFPGYGAKKLLPRFAALEKA